MLIYHQFTSQRILLQHKTFSIPELNEGRQYTIFAYFVFEHYVDQQLPPA